MSKLDKLLDGIAEKSCSIIEKMLTKLDNKLDDEEFVEKVARWIDKNVEVEIKSAPKMKRTEIKVISYLKNVDDEGNGFCANGHFNIIPACTVIDKGKKLYCSNCGELIFEVVEKKVI